MFSASKTAGPSGYAIQRSVRLRSSASAYFNRTMGTPTTQNTWTYSAWVKRGALSTFQNLLSDANKSLNTQFLFDNTNSLSFYYNTSYVFTTSALYRDSSAWYHVVLSVNSSASGTNKVNVYVNGSQVTSFSTDNRSSFSTSLINTSGSTNLIGAYGNIPENFLDGYLTEINFIDGQALTPTSFGAYNSTTGVWQPIRYSGTYGTNGFYLNFSDNSAATAAAIGKDYSGNGNNWTPNNISVTAGVTYDSMTDVPTLTSATNANFAVLNPIGTPFANGTVTDGNLKFAGLTTTDKGVAATISIPSGTFYWESTQLSNSGASNCYAGIILTGASSDVNANRVYVRGDGIVLRYGTNLGAVFPTFTNNDVIGCAYDRANNTLALYKNGTLGYTVTGLTSADHTPWVGGYTTTDTWAINFGQRPFSYTPPTGYNRLNTYNLATPTIPNGAVQMAATTYTGTGSAMTVTNTVNSVSFQPDFLWIKQRNNAANHVLADSIRGVNKYIFSNLTNAEATATAGTGITAFNSNGFSLGTETSTVGSVNAAGGTGTYIAWQWKASNTTAVSNTSGSITSSVSANPTAGFSIVTYTGTGANATVGHGLGIAPKMVIVKNRTTGATDWCVWHTSVATIYGSSYCLFLELTNNAGSYPGVFNSTAPTSSVFSIGTSSGVNTNTNNYVAYCFSEIAGYSKFGSYTGNGSTDGPFVYTGMRPRWIMIKRTDTTGDWNIIDTSRSVYNQTDNVLWANLTNADSAGQFTDILSNGFKLRSTGLVTNASGGTYIYAAFAENPFNYSLAR